MVRSVFAAAAISIIVLATSADAQSTQPPISPAQPQVILDAAAMKLCVFTPPKQSTPFVYSSGAIACIDNNNYKCVNGEWVKDGGNSSCR